MNLLKIYSFRNMNLFINIIIILLVVQCSLPNQTIVHLIPNHRISHYSVIKINAFPLKDTIENARILEIHNEKCNQIRFASGFLIVTQCYDTLLVYEICCNKTFIVGEKVDVLPYKKRPRFDKFYVDTIQENNEISEMKIKYRYFGIICKIE